MAIFSSLSTMSSEVRQKESKSPVERPLGPLRVVSTDSTVIRVLLSHPQKIKKRGLITSSIVSSHTAVLIMLF